MQLFGRICKLFLPLFTLKKFSDEGDFFFHMGIFVSIKTIIHIAASTFKVSN